MEIYNYHKSEHWYWRYFCDGRRYNRFENFHSTGNGGRGTGFHKGMRHVKATKKYFDGRQKKNGKAKN